MMNYENFLGLVNNGRVAEGIETTTFQLASKLDGNEIDNYRYRDSIFSAEKFHQIYYPRKLNFDRKSIPYYGFNETLNFVSELNRDVMLSASFFSSKMTNYLALYMNVNSLNDQPLIVGFYSWEKPQGN